MILTFNRFESARAYDEIESLTNWLTENTCDGIVPLRHNYPKYFVFVNSSFKEKLREIGEILENSLLHEQDVDLFSVTNGHGWTLYEISWRHPVQGGFLLYHDYYLHCETDALGVQLKLSGFQ
jgi:hypothetical protein